MARRTHDDALGVAGAETIIGTGVTVRGNLYSESDITIDGLLAGDIKTQGDVTIGVNANIEANIEATNITVAGNLKGDITASGEATIRETGQVKGDIRAAGLAISSGGIFIGRSLMTPPDRLGPVEDPSIGTHSPTGANPDGIKAAHQDHPGSTKK